MSKYFLLVNCLIYCAVGFAVWLIVSRFTLCTWDWALCFTGYSGFFGGFIGGIIRLYRR